MTDARQVSVACAACGAKEMTFSMDDLHERLSCPCGEEQTIPRQRNQNESDVVAIVCGPGGRSTVIRRVPVDRPVGEPKP